MPDPKCPSTLSFGETRKRNPDGPNFWFQECLGFLHLGDVLAAEDCSNQLGESHPEKYATAQSRRLLHVYRGEWDAALSIIESLLERLPGDRFLTWSLADLVARQGDLERAGRLMTYAFPELLGDQLKLTATDLRYALTFAAILHAKGDTQRRDVLLLAMEERIATMHRTRGAGFRTIDVNIHAMRGDHDRAIAGLREAIDVGWRNVWWTLRSDLRLESLHQDPEFIALMNELEADILIQRQWYEENKDKSLSEIDF